MARQISDEYRLGRKIIAGVQDPTGLKLTFELDGHRVFCHLELSELLVPGRLIPPGLAGNVSDDLGHATLGALRKRVGVTRESRFRFLKPLYRGDLMRADGRIINEAGDVFTIGVRLLNSKEELCIEGEVEIFALGAAQVRRMTPDGMLPSELRRFFPS